MTNTPDKIRFQPGTIIATVGAIQVADNHAILEMLRRHLSGDWGELSDEDKKANEHALRHGERILSSYRTESGDKLWVITEASRESNSRANTGGILTMTDYPVDRLRIAEAALLRIKEDAEYCYGKPYDFTARLGEIAKNAIVAMGDAFGRKDEANGASVAADGPKGTPHSHATSEQSICSSDIVQAAKEIAEYANKCCRRSDGYEEDVSALAKQKISGLKRKSDETLTEETLREIIDAVTDKDFADSFELATGLIEVLRPFLRQPEWESCGRGHYYLEAADKLDEQRRHLCAARVRRLLHTYLISAHGSSGVISLPQPLRYSHG